MRIIKTVILLVLIGLCAALPVRAADDLEVSLSLWRLVNELRVSPLETLARAGIDEAAARSALGPDGWILDRGLPPLALNEQLYVAAVGHLEDMMANLFYSHLSSDGKSPSARIAAAGYEATLDGETLGAIAFWRFIEPLEAARLIFENWLRDELDPARQEPRNILNPDLTEIGLAFGGIRLSLGGDLPANVYVAVADFGRPLQERAFILGNVYRAGPDGVYSPGDGVPGVHLTLSSEPAGDWEAEGRSGLLGAYQLSQRPGWSRLEARDEEGKLLFEIVLYGLGVNQLMDWPFPEDGGP